MARRPIPFVIVCLLALGVLLAGCSAPSAGTGSSGSTSAKWPENIVLAGYPEASDSYPYNVGLAKVISEKTPSKGIVKGFAGSAPILQALGANSADIVAMNSYDAAKAYFGEGAGFEGKGLDIALLAYLWPGELSFGVRPNEGIDKIADLKGKTVSLTTPMNPILDASQLILEYHGIWNTVKNIPQTGIPQIRDGMINKTIDAFTYASGAAFTLEIQQAVGLKWIPVEPEAIKAAQQKMPGVMMVEMAPRNLKLYGMPDNTKFTTYAYPYTLMARPDMPDAVVEGLLKAIFENTNILADAMYRGTQTNIKTGADIQSHIIPFHPAAIKFYKDKGVWSSQNEEQQKKLLSMPRKK